MQLFGSLVHINSNPQLKRWITPPQIKDKTKGMTKNFTHSPVNQVPTILSPDSLQGIAIDQLAEDCFDQGMEPTQRVTLWTARDHALLS